VAALRVREHDQPGRARVAADLLERAQPVRAERLEERELRLDADRVRRDRVDDPAAEARARLGRRLPREVRVACELDRQHGGPGGGAGGGRSRRRGGGRFRSTAAAGRWGKRVVVNAGSAATSCRTVARKSAENE